MSIASYISYLYWLKTKFVYLMEWVTLSYILAKILQWLGDTGAVSQEFSMSKRLEKITHYRTFHKLGLITKWKRNLKSSTIRHNKISSVPNMLQVQRGWWPASFLQFLQGRGPDCRSSWPRQKPSDSQPLSQGVPADGCTRGAIFNLLKIIIF